MQLSICKLLLVKEHCLLILPSYPNESAAPTVLSCADIQSPHVFFIFLQSEGGAWPNAPPKDALAVDGAQVEPLLRPYSPYTVPYALHSPARSDLSCEAASAWGKLCIADYFYDEAKLLELELEIFSGQQWEESLRGYVMHRDSSRLD